MTRWYKEKKREHFYKEAKKKGYRARSAFKLLQIQKKFNVIKKSDFVLDLGAAPGGWSQVARNLVGTGGKVIGIDLLHITPLDGVVFLKGDMTKKETLQKILDIAGKRKADVILSDMSPNISGAYSLDQARSVFLCEKALDSAKVLLKPGGVFVCKIFEGEDLKDFLTNVESIFKDVKKFTPPASRKSSSEVYIIGKCLRK
jgi:23S rRNA (uridine2552-2'-O)-methyltransferase